MITWNQNASRIIDYSRRNEKESKIAQLFYSISRNHEPAMLSFPNFQVRTLRKANIWSGFALFWWKLVRMCYLEPTTIYFEKPGASYRRFVVPGRFKWIFYSTNILRCQNRKVWNKNVLFRVCSYKISIKIFPNNYDIKNTLIVKYTDTNLSRYKTITIFSTASVVTHQSSSHSRMKLNSTDLVESLTATDLIWISSKLWIVKIL